MKKLLAISLVILISSFSFAKAQQSGEGELDSYQVEKKTQIDKRFYKNYSHWRFAWGGGFNLMIVEREGEPSNPFTNYKDAFMGSGYMNIGYFINPCWGFLVEYGFTPINKQIYTTAKDEMGLGHEACLKLDVNLLNLFGRCRYNPNWNFDLVVGGGVYLYNKKKNPQTGALEASDTYRTTLYIPIGLQLEYCPISQLGISLEAAFKWYSDDDINYKYTQYQAKNNDAGLYGGIGIRYNIEAKGKKHVRAVDMMTYEQVDVRVVESSSKTALDSLAKAQKQSHQMLLEELNRLNDEIAELQRCCADSNRAVATTTIIDRSRDTVIERHTSEITREYLMMTNGTDENAIYFDFNSAKVQTFYEVVIARVARNMVRDKSLKIKVVSYCDKAGNKDYNNDLGKRRVDAVVNLLVYKYHIDEKRITKKYDGQVMDDFDSFNRRCDIIYK